MNWGAGKVKDPLPGLREYDALSVTKFSPLVFNFRKLLERMLITACMSPVPSSLAYLLKKYDRSITSYFLCSLNN